jgi:hypothetical protein
MGAAWIVSLPLAATSRGTSRRFHRAAVLAVSAGPGLAFVYVCNWVVELRDVALAGTALNCLMGFGNPSVTPVWMGASIMPYVALEIAALHASSRTPTETWLATLVLAFGYAVAASIAVTAHRTARNAYRQERIIEAQKLTIARERARSEALLKQELSHQVAERSRELGAVLAKSDVTLDVRRLSPGERFDARYRIVAALGAGGMGAVYEVERLTDGATLALKAVVGEVSGASAARFAREAEIGARVHHPNLVSIVDVGVSAGVPFLVMELVRGGSLEGQRARFGDVPWALPILRQIAEGLAALHDAGVVHRDLKPANVLLTTNEGGSATVAKISDFGISRFGALDDAAASIDPNAATIGPSAARRSSALTGTGMVMGTPLYMAPEAARGGRNVDAPADVFALGIIAYEMLTGRAPFAVPAVMLAMAEQPIPAPTPIDDARVPPALGGLVLGCLSGDPTKRPRVRKLLAELTSARPS